MYYGGFTYTEARELSLEYRRWFCNRIQSEINKSNKGEAPQGSRATHHNTPEVNALLGKRNDVPSRMRRFT